MRFGSLNPIFEYPPTLAGERRATRKLSPTGLSDRRISRPRMTRESRRSVYLTAPAAPFLALNRHVLNNEKTVSAPQISGPLSGTPSFIPKEEIDKHAL